MNLLFAVQKPRAAPLSHSIAGFKGKAIFILYFILFDI